MFEFDSNSEMMFEFEFEFFMLTLNFHVFNLGMTYTVFCVDSIENDQHKNRQGLSLMFENIDVYSLSLSLKGIV